RAERPQPGLVSGAAQPGGLAQLPDRSVGLWDRAADQHVQCAARRRRNSRGRIGGGAGASRGGRGGRSSGDRPPAAELLGDAADRGELLRLAGAWAARNEAELVLRTAPQPRAGAAPPRVRRQTPRRIAKPCAFGACTNCLVLPAKNA